MIRWSLGSDSGTYTLDILLLFLEHTAADCPNLSNVSHSHTRCRRSRKRTHSLAVLNIYYLPKYWQNMMRSKIRDSVFTALEFPRRLPSAWLPPVDLIFAHGAKIRIIDYDSRNRFSTWYDHFVRALVYHRARKNTFYLILNNQFK